MPASGPSRPTSSTPSAPGKRATEPSFWDGLKYMEMTEAIFRSCKENKTVSLPFEDLERDDGGPSLGGALPPIPNVLKDIGP